MTTHGKALSTLGLFHASYVLGASVLAALPSCGSSPGPRAQTSAPSAMVSVEPVPPPLTPSLVASEKARVLTLPGAEQRAEWRRLAAAKGDPALQAEALKRLAWARDPAGVDLAVAALDGDASVGVRAAQALAEYDLPAAERAKSALAKALESPNADVRAAVAWTLVCLGDPRGVDASLTALRDGPLTSVARLDAGPAFDAQRLAALIEAQRLATLVRDPSAAVRALVATGLSQTGDASYTDALVALAADSVPEVRNAALVGLAMRSEGRARTALSEALRDQTKEQRQQSLASLRQGGGTTALVGALEALTSTGNKSTDWYQRERIWTQIDEVADPSGGDKLVATSAVTSHPHWSYRAGRALASVGDLRGVAALVTRLEQDRHEIYSDEENDYQLGLRRHNNEHVEAARMVADLAVLHPDRRLELRKQAEAALEAWLHSLPLPHANGLRALSALGSTTHEAELRRWADPQEPLPREGQQPPMPDEWILAQVSLRYLGRYQTERDFELFTKQLKRKPPNLDVTMEALFGGGIAILGMSLRAVGVGAAQGLGEWGTPRAVAPLLEYIEDPKQNEQSREVACHALAWVADARGLANVAERVLMLTSDTPADAFHRQCLLATLERKPLAEVNAALLPLLAKETELTTRHQVARALGKAGFSPETEERLFAMLAEPAVQLDAALALLLGGSPETAARALAVLGDAPPEALRELQELWYLSFDFWSEEDLSQGRLFRVVDNAIAASRVDLGDQPQDWVKEQLSRQLSELRYDNGPHSLTRVVLRTRLLHIARGSDATQSAQAIATLRLLNEEGALFALRSTAGETGRLATRAHQELTNPKPLVGVADIITEQ